MKRAYLKPLSEVVEIKNEAVMLDVSASPADESVVLTPDIELLMMLEEEEEEDEKNDLRHRIQRRR